MTLPLTLFKKTLITITIGLIGSISANAISFDQNVTSNVIMGSGIGNGGWTVDQNNGIELGLRAKVRLPTPLNVFNSDGAGNYSFTTFANAPGAKVNWNYEFSINSDYSTGTNKLTDYDYLLGIDFDVSQGVSFAYVNPFAVWTDNSLGDNSTAQSAGDDTNLPANFNLAQNSQNLGWAGADGSVDATYDFTLIALTKGTNQVLAQTNMTVIVGNGGQAVPDGGATALLLFISGIGIIGLRRRLVE